MKIQSKHNRIEEITYQFFPQMPISSAAYPCKPCTWNIAFSLRRRWAGTTTPPWGSAGAEGAPGSVVTFLVFPQGPAREQGVQQTAGDSDSLPSPAACTSPPRSAPTYSCKLSRSFFDSLTGSRW